jgi:hypothetical protein
MKTIFLTTLAAFAFSSAVGAANVHIQRIDRGGEGGQSPSPATAPSAPRPASAVPPMSRSGGPEPARRSHSRPDTRVRSVRFESGSLHSNRFGNGAGRTRVVRRNGGPAPHNHGAIANNTRIVRTVQQHHRVNVIPTGTRWHTADGIRYAHRYHRGHHWYGFYHGHDFYWTRYHHNRWWWYDPAFSHWVYWSNGSWWWPGPSNVLYVYHNNSYTPYTEVSANATIPQPPAELEPPTTPEDIGGGAWDSPDGTRMVQIAGADSEAFLYEKSGGESKYLEYLGKHVKAVRFSEAKNGKPAQILLDFENGSFALFSLDGKRLS